MLTKEFFTAGNATFTIEPAKSFTEKHNTKAHYTYKINRSKDGKRLFVNFFVGSENDSDSHYLYMGCLNEETGEFYTTGASKFDRNDWACCILRRTLAIIFAGKGEQMITDAGWNVHHEGRCCRCGRKLTVPASIETGIGPECESFVSLGITSPDEVPNMEDRTIAGLQYSYWMTGDKLLITHVFLDACLDAGFDDQTAEHYRLVTKAVMRRFKKGKKLSREFISFATSTI